MKTRILFTTVTILLAVSLAQGAHLANYEGGGLWGQVDRDINDSDTWIPSDPRSNAGGTYCEASIDGGTEYSTAKGSMLGEVTAASYWGEDLGTAVTLDANANCYSEDDPTAKLWSYGTVRSFVPGTDGVFFVIEADAGEDTGDPVQVQLHWSARCTTFYGDAQASVMGGSSIYLTRNSMPGVVPPTGIMWSREGVTFTEEDSIEAGGSFNAEIGDVIGVFFGADATANLEGAGSSVAGVSTSMELLATVLPPVWCPADFNNDGIVDFKDFAVFASYWLAERP